MPVLPPKPLEPEKPDDYLETAPGEFKPNVPSVGLELSPGGATNDALAGRPRGVQKIGYQPEEQPQQEQQPEISSVESFLTGEFNGFTMPDYKAYDWREREARANARALGYGWVEREPTTPSHSAVEGVAGMANALGHVAQEMAWGMVGLNPHGGKTPASDALVEGFLETAYKGITIVHDVMTGQTPIRVPDAIGAREELNPEVIHRTTDLVTVLPLASGVIAGAKGVVTGVAANPRNAALPGFYSALTKAVEDSTLKSAGAEQWIGTIKNTPGIKMEELEWIGLEPWLRDRNAPDITKDFDARVVERMTKGEPKITKEEVLDFVRANEVHVEETLRGPLPPTEKPVKPTGPRGTSTGGQARDMFTRRMRVVRELPLARDDEIALVRDRARNDWRTLQNEIADALGPEDRELAGRTNPQYPIAGPMVDRIREGDFDAASEAALLLRSRGERRVKEKKAKDKGEALPTKYDRYTMEGGKNYRELLLTLPSRKKDLSHLPRSTGERPMAEMRQVLDAPDYHSGHWDEPNIIAHVRFKDRKDIDGKKTLGVEEFQSDWHQQGREKGYKSAVDEADEAAFHNAERTYAAKVREGDAIDLERRKILAQAKDGMSEELRVKLQRQLEELAARDVKVRLEQGEWLQKKTELGRVLERARSGVPDAPFKTSWPELALKRVVKWAVDHGYDQVTWTPGQVQADRYRLSKHVDEISWGKQPHRDIGENRMVRIDVKQGDRISLEVTPDGTVVSTYPGQRVNFDGKKIDEIFGKGVAKRIMETPEGSLKEEGLSIGGEGMKGFYDKIMPNLANKLFNKKQYGNAKVGVTKVLGDKEIPDKYMVSSDPSLDPLNRYFVKDTETGEAVSGTFSSIQQALKWARENLYREAGTEVWALPITDEMRKAVMGKQGFALFANKSKIASALSAGLASRRERNAAVRSADPAAGLRYALKKRAEQMDLDPKQRVQPEDVEQVPIKDYEASAEAGEDLTHLYPRLTRDEYLATDKKGKVRKVARVVPIIDNKVEIAKRIADRAKAEGGKATQYFYHTGLLGKWAQKLGFSPEYVTQWMKDFSEAYAAFSPRTPTEPNLRNSTLALAKEAAGIPLREIVGPGTGGISEKGYPMMTDKRGIHGKLDDARREGRMNYLSNPKPWFFSKNVAGNLKVVTADTHAIRAVLYVLNEIKPGALKGWIKKEFQKAYEADPTKLDPAKWIEDELGSISKKGVQMQVEYGPFADVFHEAAKILGVEPAEVQSMTWFAFGKLTGLKSQRKTIIDLVNERINVTARVMEISEKEAAKKLLRREIPLMANPETAGLAALIIALNEHPTYKNFKNWFGESKVKDKNGFPQVVYHGSNSDFEVFETQGRHGLFGQGSYFTENPEVASEYARKGAVYTRTGVVNERGQVYPVYLHIENPLVMEAKPDLDAWAMAFGDVVDIPDTVKTNEQAYRMVEEALHHEYIPEYEGAEIMLEGVRNMGHDGITHIGGGRRDSKDARRHRVWIAFDPEQIKSAIGNKGAFDPKSESIISANPKEGAAFTGVSSAVAAAGGKKDQEKK